MPEKEQRLAIAICDFLRDSGVKSDDSESLEIACQCIEETFGVSGLSEEQKAQFSVKPASLLTIFEVYLATQKKTAASSKSVSAETKAKAEELKNTGNMQMKNNQYSAAITSYTQAIALDNTNPIYFSNRSAAYSHNLEYDNAVRDAHSAIEIDPKFSKAYSRLGHAKMCQGEYEEAKQYYESGLKLDPKSDAMIKGLAASKAKLEGTSEASGDSLESARGAAPGGAGLGGMDFGSMMNNPAFMQQASTMMNNPAFSGMLQNIMGDPSLMNKLMTDPNIMNMAKNMMGNKE